MELFCYNCRIPLLPADNKREHIPAQNLYEGYSPEYKKNRIVVPCCFTCNNRFSKIDQEIRDFIGIGKETMGSDDIITQKAVRSIMRKSN